MITDKQWELIFKWRDELAKEIIGYELYECQKKFSNKIIKATILSKGETFVAQWTRQFGKTTILAKITIPFLLLSYFSIVEKFNIPHMDFFNIGFFAPQEQQVKTDFDIVKDTIALLINKGYKMDIGEYSGNTIRINRGKYPSRMVYAFTASPTSHPESKTLNLIILEESQDLIDQQVNKAILPMGASTNANVVWIGVAGYKRCQFQKYKDELDSDHKVIVDYKDAIKEQEVKFAETGSYIYKNYAKYIDKQKREIGEDSDEFKTQYGMEWMLEKGQFITYEDLLMLEEDYEIQESYNDRQEFYAGIDWGKMHDSTILTVINANGKILGWHTWRGDNYNNQINDIVYLLRSKYKSVKKVWCDATANQDMAVDSLKAAIDDERRCHTVVIGYKMTSQSKDYMWKNLNRLMRDKRMAGKVIERSLIRFPKEYYNVELKERFIKQFLDLQKDINNGIWKCNHPDGPNFHDDFCDSLALACLAFKSQKKNKYSPYIA